MIKRIIDISEAAYLHLKNKQLLIDKNSNTVGSVPIEDLGVLILQHPAIVITQSAIVACQYNNVVIVFCDNRHLPYSILLPLSDGHTLHNKILQTQVAVKTPTKKRLWQQIIKQKICEQVTTLRNLNKETKRLERLADKVKSGDTENHEAQAAKQYWRLLMGHVFRRNADKEGINALLNYGYAIMRAMIARAIVGGGLHPALGLHHHNQYNGLCLADDLMEPFRPWVDRIVYQIIQNNNNATVNQKTKQSLLELLSERVIWKDRGMPLMVACHYLIANLKEAYTDNTIKLHYPKLKQGG
jgi:CRISP-associated protein Cas1